MTEMTQSRRPASRRRHCRCCILFWGFAGLTCS